MMDILIVDDEKNSRGTIKLMLERMKIKDGSIREADSVNSAIEPIFYSISQWKLRCANYNEWLCYANFSMH